MLLTESWPTGYIAKIKILWGPWPYSSIRWLSGIPSIQTSSALLHFLSRKNKGIQWAGLSYFPPAFHTGPLSFEWTTFCKVLLLHQGSAKFCSCIRSSRKLIAAGRGTSCALVSVLSEQSSRQLELHILLQIMIRVPKRCWNLTVSQNTGRRLRAGSEVEHDGGPASPPVPISGMTTSPRDFMWAVIHTRLLPLFPIAAI